MWLGNIFHKEREIDDERLALTAQKEVPSVVATTFYTPAEAKHSGTPEEELKAAIEQFDFIVH